MSAGGFDPGVQERLTKSSFAMDLDLMPVRDGESPPCAEVDFTGRFQQVGGDWYFVAGIGANGKMIDRGFTSTTKLERTGSGYRATGRADSGIVFQLPLACGEDLLLEELTFGSFAYDERGDIARFVARAAGYATNAPQHDTELATPVAVTARLTGELDTEAPRIGVSSVAGEPARPLSPLAVLDIPFSEPVRTGSPPEIVDEHGVSWPVERVTGKWLNMPPGFEEGADPAFWLYRVLPISAFGLTLALRQEVTDLAGNPLHHEARFRTSKDLGILRPEGFEGDVPAVDPGSLDYANPITGNRSLPVRDSSRTFHLQGGPAGLVRFKAQNMVAWNADVHKSYRTIFIQAAIIGSTDVRSFTMPPDTLGGSALPVHDVHLQMPTSNVDVIISFKRADVACATGCVDIGARIDDLRAE
jgi:hypothetical protein